MATAAKSQHTAPSPAAAGGGGGGLARWTPTLPTSLISMLNPFASDNPTTTTTTNNNNNSNSNAIHASTDSGRAPGGRRSMLAAVRFYDHAPARPASPTGSSAGSAMFAEPDSRSNSEIESREGSILSANPRQPKSARSKTCYSVCHPPPASLTRTRLHRRPRSLLQLHELSASSRPTPAFDVIPSANLSVRLTRAIAREFTARHGLCANDLLVLHAEKYSAQEEDEEQETDNIIGLICKGRKDDNAACKARICVVNGKEWEACCLPNGGYEFSTTDEHGLGLTVRWVVKKSKDRGATTPQSQPRHKRFNFSTISPNSRRHPIIATLSRSGLEINNTYRMPDSTARSPTVTPRETSSVLAEAMQDEVADSQPSCTTDPELRELITLTSIWVTFKEGWSPSFRYDDKDRDRESTRGVPSSPQKAPDTPILSSATLASDKAGSVRSLSTVFLRKGSLRANKRSSVVSSVPSVNEEAGSSQSRTSSVDHLPAKHGRNRSDSDSTVLMHPVPANRRKSNHQATWRPDLLVPKSPLKEVSRENSLDERPRQFKRTSWQVHSGELNAAQKEPPAAETPRAANGSVPDTPTTGKADHSDLDSKPDTNSDSTHDGRHSPVKSRSQQPSNRDSPNKRRNGNVWRKLWCGSGAA